MKKVAYIISDIDHALTFEWIAAGLRSKVDLLFILIGKEKSSLSFFLARQSIKCYEVSYRKHPFRWQQWIELLRILRREKPDVVHSHLWNANLLGLTTAWLLRIRQRVLTRHHATTHYREHPSGRKWDRLCNALATDIVAVSENIKDILEFWDRAPAMKIKLIHHGFNFQYFEQVRDDRVDALAVKYNLQALDGPVVGVISRYMEWKGVQYVIPGFMKVRERFPGAKLVLANADGEYAAEIRKLLAELPPDSFREIRFEMDLAALYQLFDVFVHVPIDPYVEAFGQTYVESLIAGVPSVFTLSGIAREFVRHKDNAWVVEFRNSNQIAESIVEILTNDDLRASLIIGGGSSIKQFSIENNILELEKLYKNS